MISLLIKKINTSLFYDTQFKLQRTISRIIQRVLEKKSNNVIRHIAIYDLNINPITYDFCPYLYFANKFFDKLNVINFELIIILKENDIEASNSYKRIIQIILPIANMCKKINQIQILNKNLINDYLLTNAMVFPEGYSKQFKRRWKYEEYLNESRLKKEVLIKPPNESIIEVEKWLNKNKIVHYITITIRNSKTHDVKRNSNLELIRLFSEWVINTGISVVIVPDSENSEIGNIKPSAICEQAALNLFFRTALYKKAVINYFNNNGPCVIPQIGGMNFIITGINNEDSQFGKAKEIKKVGLKIGAQPFSSNNQGYFIWGDESLDSLITYHKKMI